MSVLSRTGANDGSNQRRGAVSADLRASPVRVSGDQLATATVDVLEEAAYVFACPSHDPPPFRHGLVQIRVPFCGPVHGTVVITGSRAILREAAEHAAWAPKRESTQAQLAYLGEMITRTFVTRRWGEEEPVSIGAADVRMVDPTTYARRRACPASIVTDGGDRIDVEVMPAGG